MSAEKLFIRDLINLCEQYGLGFWFDPDIATSAIVNKGTSEYEILMSEIKAFE